MLKPALVLLMLGAAAVPVEAACRVERFTFVYGSDTATSMVTPSGARCEGHINGHSSLSGGSVVQPPAHGTASFEGHQFSYQSRPGYVGPDAFTVAISGTSYRRGRSGSYALDGTTNINFAVQVVR